MSRKRGSKDEDSEGQDEGAPNEKVNVFQGKKNGAKKEGEGGTNDDKGSVNEEGRAINGTSEEEDEKVVELRKLKSEYGEVEGIEEEESDDEK